MAARWRRRDWLAGCAAAGLAAAAAPATGAARGAGPRPGVLRVAFNTAEVGFDPPQVSDQTSVVVNAHIFEPPLSFARDGDPGRLVPLTAASLPEVHDGHRRFVFSIRPGIRFDDHPAFGGRPRELTAADYVYSLRRYADPRLKSEHLYQFDNAGILGWRELRQRVRRDRVPYPYDEPLPGLRVLDRYRFEVRVAQPSPRLPYLFASGMLAGALAREVVEHHGDAIAEHPVGTGPYRLAAWRRASGLVLERQPHHRDPASGAAPALERIELAIIEEDQPRWLAFLGGELDALELPNAYAPLAVPHGRLAPFLAQRGVRMRRQLTPAVSHTFFNGDDPVVGGVAPAQVALRRAVALAYDNAAEARQIRRGQAQVAQSMLAPHTSGFDPALQSELGHSDPARARALLDLYGYHDRDGDGWRERPDGSPLLLRMASLTDQRSRSLNELWQRRMAAVGLRMRFEAGTFGELIRRSLAGSLMMWGFTWTAGSPDGDFFLALAYGPNADQSNDARFALPAFDRLYERQRALPDGPERLALMQRARNLMLAYMPYIAHGHPIVTDLVHAGVAGLARHPFTQDWWRYASHAADAPERAAADAAARRFT